MARLSLTRDFKVSQKETLCAFPIRLPRCVADATWGLQMWINVGWDSPIFWMSPTT